MLSDEEKEAIDLLKKIDKQKCMILECPVVKNNIERQLKIIELNRIIRKQSKEIEELKEKKGYHLGFIAGGIAKKYEIQDKIKAKIEEVKDGTYDAKIVLESLLEKE